MMELKALVVDDEIDIRDLISSIIRTKGFASTPASSCDEAGSMLEHGDKFDIIISDYQTGGNSNGIDLLRYVRDNKALDGVLFVMMTATPSVREQCSEFDNTRFLRKPFEVKEVFEAVE